MPRGPANVINDDVFTKSVIEQAKDVLGDFGDLRHKRLLLHACSKDEFADRVEAGQGTKVSSSLDLPSGAVMAPLVSGLKSPIFFSVCCFMRSVVLTVLSIHFIEMQVLKSSTRLPSARPTRAVAVASRRPLLVIKQRRFCVVRSSEVG